MTEVKLDGNTKRGEMSDKLHVITTLDKLNEVIDYFRSNIVQVDSMFSFDVETDGACPITKTITGFSFSLFPDEGFYFPFLAMTDERGICTEAPVPLPKEGQNVDKKLMECVSPAFKARALDLLAELAKHRSIMHNATFDIVVTRRNYGIDFINSIYCDTMLLKHTLDCDRPHGLKECAAKYFGESEKEEQEELGGSVLRNGGKWTKSDKWIWYGDVYYVGKYGAKDTVMALKLFNHLDPQLDALELRSFFYEDEVMPLLKLGTIPMKDTGFKIDVNHFKRAKLRIQAEIDDLDTQLRDEISDIAGEMEQIHLDKEYPPIPKRDFAEMLILEAGLPLPTNPKTGAFSTAKGVIKTWAQQVLKSATEDQIKVIWFIQEECDKVPMYLIHKVQRRLWEEKKAQPIINLGSPKQFEYIVGKKWGVKSSKVTKGGDQSFDAKEIESIAIKRMQEIEGLSEAQAQERFYELMEADSLDRNADWFIKYLRKKKLENLISTFIDGILELAIDGRIHTDMLQHGTTSGRYASVRPNCLSMDTEILTDKGWLTYDNWDLSAKVAAFKDGKVNWELPENIYVSEEEPKTMVNLKNQHVDIRATDDHRITLQHRKSGKFKEFTFAEVYSNSMSEYKILHGGIGDFKGLDLTNDEIRFLVAIQADGYLQSDDVIRFTFTKERKRDRLRNLLNRLGFNYKEPNNKRYDFYIYNMSDFLKGKEHLIKDKVFNWGLVQMSISQREVFLEELNYWDGLSTRLNKNYNSCTERNVDVVQAILALNGDRGHKRKYSYNLDRGEGSMNYQLDITKRNYSLLANVSKHLSESTERVWCVKVPSDQFIARRGSDTFVVNNCQQLPSHSALGLIIKRGFIA